MALANSQPHQALANSPPPPPQNFQALAEPHPPPPPKELCSDPEDWEVLLRAFAGPDLPAEEKPIEQAEEARLIRQRLWRNQQRSPSCSRPSSSHERLSIANQLPALTSDSLTCIGGSQTGIECPCHERFGWDAKNCPSWKMSEHLDTSSFEQGLRSVRGKVTANRPELHEKWSELYALWEKSTTCPAVEPYLKHVSIAVHQVKSCSTYHFQLLCVSCGHCSALMYCE